MSGAISPYLQFSSTIPCFFVDCIWTSCSKLLKSDPSQMRFTKLEQPNQQGQHLRTCYGTFFPHTSCLSLKIAHHFIQLLLQNDNEFSYSTGNMSVPSGGLNRESGTSSLLCANGAVSRKARSSVTHIHRRWLRDERLIHRMSCYLLVAVFRSCGRFNYLYRKRVDFICHASSFFIFCMK
jgi:hypothetical protein